MTRLALFSLSFFVLGACAGTAPHAVQPTASSFSSWEGIVRLAVTGEGFFSAENERAVPINLVEGMLQQSGVESSVACLSVISADSGQAVHALLRVRFAPTTSRQQHAAALLLLRSMQPTAEAHGDYLDQLQRTVARK